MRCGWRCCGWVFAVSSSPFAGIILEAAQLKTPKFCKILRATLNVGPSSLKGWSAEIHLDSITPEAPCSARNATMLTKKDLLIAEIDIAVQMAEAFGILVFGKFAA